MKFDKTNIEKIDEKISEIKKKELTKLYQEAFNDIVSQIQKIFLPIFDDISKIDLIKIDMGNYYNDEGYDCRIGEIYYGIKKTDELNLLEKKGKYGVACEDDSEHYYYNTVSSWQDEDTKKEIFKTLWTEKQNNRLCDYYSFLEEHAAWILGYYQIGEDENVTILLTRDSWEIK